MVDLEPVQNGGMADFKANAMAIAIAFQAASDDDTRNVLNAMSSKTRSSLEALKFYIVSASWFVKAWPLLMAREPTSVNEGFREQIGRILNGDLLSGVENAVSSSDEEDGDVTDDGNNNGGPNADRTKRRFERLHRKMAMSRQKFIMRKGLQHKRDFYFLGPSAWMLVKEKFGFDGHEIGRECTFAGDSQNVVAIKLLTEEVEDNKATLISIPLSGRFAYEKVIAKAETGAALDIVSEEDEEGGDSLPWTSAIPEAADASQSEDGPILLLHATTTVTSTNQSSDLGKSLYPSLDDMDVDSGMGDDKLSSSPTSAAEGTRIMASRKRFASGLANMGNTCFMNSMLQCLAHTESLRRYFLSGEYENDLNRDNPLGTGGDLATQFAYLLSEMWGVPTKRRTVMGTTEYNYANSSTSAVYPRSFKYTLGKHAEQFSGYDQHDSQELATYLLDALHEDTNRVTKKPYVEKPEQGEDEPDEVAAMKAWRLHLQRDDSKVLENFMGQVKSRVQCSEEGCNRVSTTFDPFMYLSVPIPGATERTMKVTFVPLDPNQRMKNVNITIAKTASISKLMGKLNEQLVQLKERDQPIPLSDLCAVDVWSHSVFKWFTGDHDIDGIRESDTTFIYELRPLSEFQEAAKQKENATEEDPSTADNRAKSRPHRFKLELGAMTKLNKQDEWKVVLEDHVQQPSMLYSMFNPNRGAIEERKKFHQRLENFIDLLYKETTDEEESTGLKRSREDSEDFGSKSEVNAPFATEEPLQSIIDRTDSSSTFKNVKSKHDIAILEFCSGKLRQFIHKMIKDKGAKFKDGILIQIVMQRPSGTAGMSSKDYTFASPLVVRIPDTMTVYGLREELARRLSRSLRPGHPPVSTYENGSCGESSSEATDKDDVMQTQEEPFGSPTLLLMRRIPLSYACKARNAGNKQIGVLERAGIQSTEGVKPVSLASSSDEAEQKLVCDMVGPNEAVNLDWPANWCDSFLDLSEYDAVDDVKGPEETDGGAQTQLASKNTSVIDCIDKYCQMEQLEETEMWYCSRCKKHVRAWKQFHLYRAPPILIVHLKRFQYSATTHRRDKISAMIDFPLVGLDLTSQVSHWADHEDPIYDCYAVSNHYGGLGGGHYTAYILSDDGTWCHYDDSRVTNNIDPSEVQSEAAYVLYYRRRDVPVGQDSICDGQTPETVSQIISDQPETARDSSEISSNNTANAGDDDMIVEDTDANSVGSSRTCPSPMGSTDGGDEPYDDPDGHGVDKITARGNPSFPLQ